MIKFFLMLVSNRQSFGAALLLTLCFAIPVALGDEGDKPRVRRVPDEYATIEEAIGKAIAGDTILIAPGTHTESVVIDRAISVKGTVGPTEDQSTRIDSKIQVTASGASVYGIRVTGAETGVEIAAGCEDVTIDSMELFDCETGVLVRPSCHRTTIKNCSAKDCSWVSYLFSSSNYIELHNNRSVGGDSHGFYLSDCNNCRLIGNHADSNKRSGFLINRGKKLVVLYNQAKLNGKYGFLFFGNCSIDQVANNLSDGNQFGYLFQNIKGVEDRKGVVVAGRVHSNTGRNCEKFGFKFNELESVEVSANIAFGNNTGDFLISPSVGADVSVTNNYSEGTVSGFADNELIVDEEKSVVALTASTNVLPQNGAIVNLRGYHYVDDGGGQLVRYHQKNKPASFRFDNGFFFKARTGYFEAIDQSVANVKRFGAIADRKFGNPKHPTYTGDDQPFIQAAIDSAAGMTGLEKVVEFPNGTYLLKTFGKRLPGSVYAFLALDQHASGLRLRSSPSSVSRPILKPDVQHIKDPGHIAIVGVFGGEWGVHTKNSVSGEPEYAATTQTPDVTVEGLELNADRLGQNFINEAGKNEQRKFFCFYVKEKLKDDRLSQDALSTIPITLKDCHCSNAFNAVHIAADSVNLESVSVEDNQKHGFAFSLCRNVTGTNLTAKRCEGSGFDWSTVPYDLPGGDTFTSHGTFTNLRATDCRSCKVQGTIGKFSDENPPVLKRFDRPGCWDLKISDFNIDYTPDFFVVDQNFGAALKLADKGKVTINDLTIQNAPIMAINIHEEIRAKLSNVNLVDCGGHYTAYSDRVKNVAIQVAGRHSSLTDVYIHGRSGGMVLTEVAHDVVIKNLEFNTTLETENAPISAIVNRGDRVWFENVKFLKTNTKYSFDLQGSDTKLEQLFFSPDVLKAILLKQNAEISDTTFPATTAKPWWLSGKAGVTLRVKNDVHNETYHPNRMTIKSFSGNSP